MVQGCWLVLTQLLLQALWTSRGPDGGLRVAPSHGSLSGGGRSYTLLHLLQLTGSYNVLRPLFHPAPIHHKLVGPGKCEVAARKSEKDSTLEHSLFAAFNAE